MVFRMPTFLQWPKITYKKQDMLSAVEEPSMVFLSFVIKILFIFISFFFPPTTACPRGHPYFVGEVSTIISVMVTCDFISLSFSLSLSIFVSVVNRCKS